MGGGAGVVWGLRVVRVTRGVSAGVSTWGRFVAKRHCWAGVTLLAEMVEPVVAEDDRRNTAELSTRTFRIACGAILLVSAIVRMWGLDQVPAGLFCDEAGNGYNAFSLLNSGRDEDGQFLPLYIWSFGVSYKNPIFIYSAIPIVGLFGLSEITIRLTAALWGVLGVASIVWLGTVLLGRRGGLWSGVFLAVSPWHLHFSRMAFELIALLPLFVSGFACFLIGVRGRARMLVPAAVLFALSLYAYAPAKMFVPLFLLGAGLLYVRPLIAAGRWTLLAATAAIVTGIPLLVFDYLHRDRSGQYFSETTILRASRSLTENASMVWSQWKTFYSPDFLLFYGDPLIRHSVPGIGQIFFVMAPLIAIGMLWAVWRSRPGGKLLLWWLVLFPLAPSLMNEVPTASRGFIGVGVMCLLAAAGAVSLNRVVAGDGHRPWRRLFADGLMCLIAAATIFEAARYGYRYVTVYPAVAASSFQYGYRGAIEAMEPYRADFDKLLLTTSEGNQPQIFPLFYNQVPPEKWLDGFDPGYVVIDPADFDRYDPQQERVLAALREADLRLFDDVEVRDRVYDPTGRQLFVVAEIKRRGRYLREWLMLGALDNSRGEAQVADYFEDHAPSLDARLEGGRRMYWRRILPPFVRIELHHFYRSAIEPSGEEPEWVCAYATTDLVVENDIEVALELDGTTQWVEAWLQGKPLKRRATQLGARPVSLPLALRSGSNQLLVKTCRGHADWSFSGRLRGRHGGVVDDVKAFARIRTDGAEDRAPEEPSQIVSGFSRVVSFDHEIPVDGDYRGDSPGWVEHLYDADGAVEWETGIVPDKLATVFAFTAVPSRLPGIAQLWVDGTFALEFETATFTEPKRWSGNGFVLRYYPRESGQYRSGVWVLYVPRANVEAGKPLRLRVSHLEGHHDASFLLKGRADTAQHEKMTLRELRESM